LGWLLKFNIDGFIESITLSSLFSFRAWASSNSTLKWLPVSLIPGPCADFNYLSSELGTAFPVPRTWSLERLLLVFYLVLLTQFNTELVPAIFTSKT
jgi:hypothetical protein